MSAYIFTQFINPCPQCKSHDVFCELTIELDKNKKLAQSVYYVLCHECDYEGSQATNIPSAVDAWNRLAFQKFINKSNAVKNYKAW